MTLASLAAIQSLDPASLSAITVLLAALGLSSTAGLRAYLPLLAVGIAGDNNLLPLNPNFQALGSPPIIALLGILAIGEFIVDKIPIVDHLSDAVHTIIRPVAGAIIMAGTQNSLSDVNVWLAAGAGALLAFIFHGVKATTRPAVTATTAGIGNPLLSTLEDVFVAAAALVLALLPVVGFLLFVLAVIVAIRLVGGLFRRVRGRRNGGGPGPLPGRRGRRPPAQQPAQPPISYGGTPGSTPGATLGYTSQGDSTTIAATNQAPYPQQQPNPIQSGAYAQPTLPAPTQTLPPQLRPGPRYPGDGPTLPGASQP
jgi:hypothetical protein